VLSIGKQKEPISGERVQSMIFNHMQERTAVADALMPSRNVGIVWNGAGSLPYSTWAVGVFNDWFDADQDFDDSATQYIGRATWAPLRTDDDSSLLHLGIGPIPDGTGIQQGAAVCRHRLRSANGRPVGRQPADLECRTVVAAGSLVAGV
jgi:phosphate-selective porin